LSDDRDMHMRLLVAKILISSTGVILSKNITIQMMTKRQEKYMCLVPSFMYLLMQTAADKKAAICRIMLISDFGLVLKSVIADLNRSLER
jgi:energy-converting hydrogenase Eha subunit C